LQAILGDVRLDKTALYLPCSVGKKRRAMAGRAYQPVPGGESS
jgi:hypothetical protein